MTQAPDEREMLVLDLRHCPALAHLLTEELRVVGDHLLSLGWCRREAVLREVEEAANREHESAADDERDDKTSLEELYDHNSYGAGFNAGRQYAATNLLAELVMIGRPTPQARKEGE